MRSTLLAAAAKSISSCIYEGKKKRRATRISRTYYKEEDQHGGVHVTTHFRVSSKFRLILICLKG